MKEARQTTEQSFGNNTEERNDHNGSEQFKQYLTFLLGNEVYGIDVNYVKEVNEYDNVYRIPTLPSYISGVMNLRGEVVPVIDLSYRFYTRKSEITKFSCIVIVEVFDGDEKKPVGVIIDAIKAVADIPLNRIEQTPSFGSKIRADFIEGVGKLADSFVILLNVESALDIEELADFGAASVSQ